MSATSRSSPHSRGTLKGIRPRAYRTTLHLVYESEDGRDYRIDLRRLQSHGDVLRVIQWLARQPGVTARSMDSFIRVACNAAGLEQPGGGRGG